MIFRFVTNNIEFPEIEVTTDIDSYKALDKYNKIYRHAGFKMDSVDKTKSHLVKPHRKSKCFTIYNNKVAMVYGQHSRFSAIHIDLKAYNDLDKADDKIILTNNKNNGVYKYENLYTFIINLLATGYPKDIVIQMGDINFIWLGQYMIIKSNGILSIYNDFLTAQNHLMRSEFNNLSEQFKYALDKL